MLLRLLWIGHSPGRRLLLGAHEGHGPRSLQVIHILARILDQQVHQRELWLDETSPRCRLFARLEQISRKVATYALFVL